VALFNAGGNVVLAGSTASGDKASGIGVGASTRSVRKRAKQFDRTLWLTPTDRAGTRLVYGVRGGKVQFVAVAARAETRNIKLLRSELSAAGLS
jgi:hypothetical protein